MRIELMKRDSLEVSAHTPMHNPHILPLLAPREDSQGFIGGTGVTNILRNEHIFLSVCMLSSTFSSWFRNNASLKSLKRQK